MQSAGAMPHTLHDKLNELGSNREHMITHKRDRTRGPYSQRLGSSTSVTSFFNPHLSLTCNRTSKIAGIKTGKESVFR
jgi:hypothetical protein